MVNRGGFTALLICTELDAPVACVQGHLLPSLIPNVHSVRLKYSRAESGSDKRLKLLLVTLSAAQLRATAGGGAAWLHCTLAPVSLSTYSALPAYLEGDDPWRLRGLTLNAEKGQWRTLRRAMPSSHLQQAAGFLLSLAEVQRTLAALGLLLKVTL